MQGTGTHLNFLKCGVVILHSEIPWKWIVRRHTWARSPCRKYVRQSLFVSLFGVMKPLISSLYLLFSIFLHTYFLFYLSTWMLKWCPQLLTLSSLNPAPHHCLLVSPFHVPRRENLIGLLVSHPPLGSVSWGRAHPGQARPLIPGVRQWFSKWFLPTSSIRYANSWAPPQPVKSVSLG